jgi:hypothetical protein
MSTGMTITLPGTVSLLSTDMPSLRTLSQYTGPGAHVWGAHAGCHRTMISMELQRDVPQYMAIPWLMTWVMARTVSV